MGSTSEHDRRDGILRLVAPAPDDPKAPYAKAQLRYCYYLHLGEAEKANESTGEQPVFDVPYKKRWVLVRKYLRDGSAQIYQLTSDEETDSGVTKLHHVHLGRIVPKSSVDSWAQCILERYPEHLIDAKRENRETRRKYDLETTRSLFKKIDAGSPDHWTVEKRM